MAPGIVLYKAFYVFGRGGGFVAYLLTATTLLSLGFAKVRCEMMRGGLTEFSARGFAWLLLLTSYPVAFCIERGNLELMVAAAIVSGTWAYWRGQSWTAAILWGVFGSVKLYPLLLLAAFLSKRQYRQFLMSIFAAVVVTVGSLFYAGPDVRTAALGIRSGLDSFLKTGSLAYDQWIGFDHSIFALLKTGLRSYNPDLASFWHIYSIALGVVMLLLYFVRIRKLPIANQLLILTICSVVLPPTSADYTLLQLYAPFLILALLVIEAARQERPMPGMTAIFGLFAFLFTPTNFIFYRGQGMSAQLKCLLLLGLFGVALVYPFDAFERVKTEEFDEIAALN